MGEKQMIFCSLYSGSSGNSIFVANENTRILIDAGLPGKSIEAALKEIDENPTMIDAIFITHEHSDHIKGVGVLSRKYDIPIYTNEATWKGMAHCIGKIKDHNIKIIEKRSVTTIKDIDVVSFNIQMLKYGPYPYPLKRRVLSEIGHLSNDACGEALVGINDESKARKIILGHLSNTNNYPELAYQTVINVLNENKVNIEKDMVLSLADRKKPSSYIEF